MKYLREEWFNSQLPFNMLEKLNSIISFEQRVDSLIKNDNIKLEEYEIKFKFLDSFAKSLNYAGFEYMGYSIEKSFIYDDEAMSLHTVDARLRIRTYRNITNNDFSSLITVKKPKPRDSIGAREFEAEIVIKDRSPEEVISAFTENDLKIVSSYERVRHYIKVKGYDVKIDVDLLPDIGRYVEIEGQETEVLEVAALLNVDLTNLIYDPYDTLHADWCLSQNRPEEDFVRFDVSYDKIITREADFINEIIN